MNTAQKIFSIAIHTTFLSTAFLYADETAQTTFGQATHVPFKPNKRHMHEKKAVKQEISKKTHSKAARIHKKELKNDATEKHIHKEGSSQHHASSIRHHEQKQLETNIFTPKNTAVKHHTIARHHQKEVKKENIFQITWEKIKAFFSSKKTT